MLNLPRNHCPAPPLPLPDVHHFIASWPPSLWIQIFAARKSMGVRPFTGAWSTYQGPHLLKETNSSSHSHHQLSMITPQLGGKGLMFHSLNHDSTGVCILSTWQNWGVRARVVKAKTEPRGLWNTYLKDQSSCLGYHALPR